MKKVSLKARFMLLSCLALGIAALSARPAEAEWKVTVAYTGVSVETPTLGIDAGTPTGWGPDESLDGIQISAPAIVLSPGNYFPTVSFTNDVQVQATYKWVGTNPTPSYLFVTENFDVHSLVNKARTRTSGYGNSIIFSAAIPSAPATPTTNVGTFGKSVGLNYTNASSYVVPFNGIVVLPMRHLQSDMNFDPNAAPAIPAGQYPSSYETSWYYDVGLSS